MARVGETATQRGDSGSGTNWTVPVTDPVTGTMTYGYSATGERSSVALPGRNTWPHQYWTNWYMAPKGEPEATTRMLKSVTDDQGRVVKYFLDTRGRLYAVERPLASGKLNTSYTYDWRTG